MAWFDFDDFDLIDGWQMDVKMCKIRLTSIGIWHLKAKTKQNIYTDMSKCVLILILVVVQHICSFLE